MTVPAFADDEIEEWGTVLDAMEHWCEQVRSRYVPIPPPHLPDYEVPAELFDRARQVKRHLVLIEMELITRREATRARINSLDPATTNSGTYA